MINERPRPEFTTQLKDAYAHYEGGKARRYNLLFSVNGGAFTIAQLLTKPENKTQVLGNLTLTHLAIGMMAFTAIMVFDIFKFGEGMQTYLGDKVFRKPGKIVLLAIGLLIFVGWGLVAFGPAIEFTK